MGPPIGRMLVAGALAGCNGAPAPASGAQPAGGDYALTSGGVSIQVDPQVGARVVALSLGSRNWLTSAAVNGTNYGSTFWTSPQEDWNWPPPPEIDNLPYAGSADEHHIVLQGAENAALGVRVTKSFAFAASPGPSGVSPLVTQYTVENRASTARSLSPWEVTRVATDGVIFYPTGASSHSAAGGPSLSTQEVAGVTWFDCSTATKGASIKYFADGSRGWIAQASGGLLFVKKFADVPPSAQAPSEAEIELYVNGDLSYIEIENQGVYQPLAGGASLDWSVRWYLVKIPDGVDPSLGSAALVAFVDAL